MNRIVVVASHRRSGTHLVLDSIRTNARGVDPRFMTLERIEPSHERHLSIAEFDRRLRQRRGTVLVKTHALPGVGAWQDPRADGYAADLLAEAPVIYVHRDGRDVLLSLYHFITTYSTAVAELSLAQFIRAPHTAPDAAGLFSRAGYWQHHVLAWLGRQPVALAAYERLGADFDGALAEIADRAGLLLRAKISAVRLDQSPAGLASARLALSNRLGIGVGRRSTAIRPRAGGSGGWREAFDEADLAWFGAEAGAAMRELGYA